MRTQYLWRFALAGLVALGTASTALASSHREAPFTAAHPTIDGTDLYMFMAYGPNANHNNVVLIADYVPFQSPWAGPNYYPLNENAMYAINIDNNGDAKPDISFEFRFTHHYKYLTVPTGDGKTTGIPLINIGPVTAGGDQKNLNRTTTYTVTMVKGGVLSGNAQAITKTSGPGPNANTFIKPVDYIGNKSLPDYQAYAQQYMYSVNIPGCDKPGKVFVGQRKEPFAINVGELFDLVNTNPLGPINAERNVLANKNITTIAMSVPKECLTMDASHPVIGGWTTSYLRQASVLNPNPANSASNAEIHGGAWTQVSRLGNPLVNELIIGLGSKNLFDFSPPSQDAQFLKFVTNPSLPVLIHTLYPNVVVPGTPRKDLVTVFLKGIPKLNQPANVTPSEEMRLNTSIAPKPAADQNHYGVLGGDTAGFPNGRRPGDDVVDIELQVALGVLCSTATPCGNMTTPPNDMAQFTGGATHYATDFMSQFPYLDVPLPGSPNELRESRVDYHSSGPATGGE